MILKIYPDAPDFSLVDRVVRRLEQGETIIYPTGISYALGCSVLKQRAVEQICQIKGIDARKRPLAIMCRDLAQVAKFARLSNENFKFLKEGALEPATYLLPAAGKIPGLFKNRKEVGIRLSAHPVTDYILEALDAPLLTGSLPWSNEDEMNYATHPELIDERFGHLVSLVLDGGIAVGQHAAIIDCTSANGPTILREAWP